MESAAATAAPAMEATAPPAATNAATAPSTETTPAKNGGGRHGRDQ
jgi:hypothetical protein